MITLKPQYVELVYVCDWYDGLLSGLVKIHGKLCFTHIADDSNPRGPWFYDAWILTDEEAIEALRQKRIFEEHVGYHSSYKDGKPVATHCSYTKKSFEKFYDVLAPQFPPVMEKKDREPDYHYSDGIEADDD